MSDKSHHQQNSYRLHGWNPDFTALKFVFTHEEGILDKEFWGRVGRATAVRSSMELELLLIW